MSKYKAGQGIVIDILEISDDGCYKLGNENLSWWSRCTSVDEISEPLTDYTMPLINKIERQRNSITSLLNKNADLKRENEELEAKYEALRKALNEFNKRVDDMCNTARAAGQQEAWELAKKCMLMTDRKREAIFGSGHNALYGVLTYFDYKHAATKVAEWEKAKEEICVGDVLLSKTIPTKCIVISFEKLENTACILWKDGSSGKRNINELKKDFKKIGHIDIASILAQIGGESDE